MDFIFYHYEPSMAGAVIFAILFTITSLLHTYQISRTRTWFMIPFVIGGFFELVGYGGRAASAADNPGPYTKGPYIIQSVLLLLAPALFAASVYMCLGRIVLMTGGGRALFIRRTWLTKIFVGGDVLSFLMQCSGAGLMVAGGEDNVTMGNNVIIGGLFVQIVFFGVFVATALGFHRRMDNSLSSMGRSFPWKRHLTSLYILSLLIFVRSIVRVVEYVQGNNGYIISHEVYLFVFDGLLMFAAMATLNWIHPSEVSAFTKGGCAMRNIIFLSDIHEQSPHAHQYYETA